MRRLLLPLLFMAFFFSDLKAQESEKEVLLNGWYLWDPYQYEEQPGKSETLTGLDVQLVRAISKKVGKRVLYEPVSWKHHLLDLKEGKRDFAAGATYTRERAEFAYYSVPYRYEENSLFVPREKEGSYSFKNVDEMLAFFEAARFRVGVIDGFIYADPKINEWLEKPEHQDQILRVPDDTVNLENLLEGKVDGFLADRVVGATVIWRAKKGVHVSEVRLGIKTPIHLIFSKKTTPLSLVEKFNQAIEKIEKTDEYAQIISWYWHPVLLLQTIDSGWFRLVDYLGIVAFAISGLVIAYRDQATLFGAFIFAVLPSLGGGIIRDLIFDRRPVGALQSPVYLGLVILTVLVGFLLIRVRERYSARDNKPFEESARDDFAASQHVLVICDAMGLAAFTVTGILVSLMAKASPLWLWGSFFAFLTGAGGGILRDSLSKDRYIVSLRGAIYPEVAVLWGFLLSVFLIYQSHTIDADPLKWAVGITVIGAFATRLAVYYLRVPNLRFRGGLSRGS